MPTQLSTAFSLTNVNTTIQQHNDSFCRVANLQHDDEIYQLYNEFRINFKPMTFSKFQLSIFPSIQKVQTCTL